MDEGVVVALLREQHPDLADLPLVPLAAGFDNVLFRLGDDLVVRLPRRQVGAELMANELRWLPALSEGLPLPTSAPVRAGRPSARFAWPWAVVRWIDGTPGDRADLRRPDDAARVFGAFLRTLHRPAPDDAPRNPARSVVLAERADAVEERLDALAALGGQVDDAAIRAVWDDAVTAPPPATAMWIHGDPHPANLVVAGGTLVGVVDFGDLCAGDPATDLAGGWLLLPAEHLAAFEAAYGGVDDAVRRRTRGWAVLFGLLLLGLGLTDRPTYEAPGRRALTNAVSALR